TSRFTALRIIRNDQGIPVEHRALKAGIRAHVLAHLLAQEPGVHVGRSAVEHNPEQLPRTERACQDFAAECADRREVAHESEASPEGEGNPQKLLQRLACDLSRAPWGLVELDPFFTVALGKALHPQEDLCPDGLWARVTAPQAAGQ